MYVEYLIILDHSGQGSKPIETNLRERGFIPVWTSRGTSSVVCIDVVRSVLLGFSNAHHIYAPS